MFLSIIFTLLIFVLIFSASEAFFRYRYDVSDGLGFLKVNVRWQQRHVQYIAYNNYFFRDTKNFDRNKKPGVVRIGVMGDSNAFGAGIKDVNNRFSNILEKELKDSGYNVEIYNLGIPGLNTDTEIDVYHHVKDLKFDILVWEYYLNDVQRKDDSTGSPILIKNSQRAKILEAMSNTSYFLDFLYWRFTSTYDSTLVALRTADMTRYKDPIAIQKHKDDISNFITELNQDHTQPVVVILPFFYFIGPHYPAYDIHQMMEGIFRQNGIEPIDIIYYLSGKTPKDVMASRFDAHPNEYVQKLIADKLYEKIVPLLNKN